jgi:hypothetical protein
MAIILGSGLDDWIYWCFLRAGLDVMKKRKISYPCLESNPVSWAVQPGSIPSELSRLLGLVCSGSQNLLLNVNRQFHSRTPRLVSPTQGPDNLHTQQ